MDNCHEDTLLLNAVLYDVRVFQSIDSKASVFLLTLLQDGQLVTLPPYECHRLDGFRINRIDPRFVAQDENGNPTDRQLQAVIRQRIATEIRERRTGILVDRTGWVELPDKVHRFVSGSSIYGGKTLTPVMLTSNLPDLRFEATADSVDITDLLRAYFRKIQRDPDILIPIAAHTIRSLLASLFEELGYPLRHVLYLVGAQGVGKTTAVRDFSLPFVDDSGALAPAARALSSKAAVRHFLAERRDMPVLLDDVCTSSSAATRRTSIEVAAYTLRFAADYIPEMRKRPNGQQSSCRCTAGVIVTGELPMSMPSDITRCVTVLVDHQMRGREPDDRAVSCAVLRNFVDYCAQYFDDVRAELSQALTAFREVPQDFSPRQHQHLAELSYAFQLLLDYARQFDAICDTDYARLLGMLHHALNRCLTINAKMVEDFERREITNPARLLLEAIKEKTLPIAKNEQEYALDPIRYVGFYDKKTSLILLRLEAIAAHFSEVSGRPCSAIAAGKLLRNQSLASMAQEGHTASAKRKGLGRFVPLDRQQLRQQAGDVSHG